MSSPSLIVTPNAVKAGKLYSIVPTNGVGDLDVVRATSATRVNASGLIEVVGNNVPRLDYTNASCPSILVEPQRTNLCLQSEMFTQSPWSGGTTVSANTDIAPDGTLTADTLTDSSVSVFQNRSQAISVSTNSTITSSVFIKKTTGTPTNYPSISVQFTGGSARTARLILNTTTGTFTISPDSNATVITGRVVSYNDYWRIEMTATDNGNNTSALLRLDPALSSDGTTISSSATGSAVFWAAQLEVGSNATSYIPTTTTSVTRNADVISKSGISDLIGQTEGTIYCELVDYTNSFNDFLFDVTNGTTSNSIRINRLSGNRTQLLFSVNGSLTLNIVNSVSGVIEPIKKIAIGYIGNNISLYVNGVLIGTNTTSEIPSNLSVINLGSRSNSTNVLNGNIKELFLTKTRLSNSELQQLTTL